MPLFQQSQMARMARIISRIRAAGWLHGIEKRLVMCGLIWLPSPRMKRPFEKACRSQPTLASIIGLRAKATAIEVPELERLGVLGRQEEREERIVRGLGRPDARVARLLRFLGLLAGLAQIESDASVNLHAAVLPRVGR